MKPKPRQTQLVKNYFDSIASVYPSRYFKKSRYHHYFFTQRIQDAIIEIDDFSGKSILDIGAGTGALYDVLKVKLQHFRYKAVDISPEMLSNSNIPIEDQIIGDVTSLNFGRQ
ncbi:MAG: methyltransferase domain-containing protein [Saprospiraceae bacterium]|nr:methyltransferase domain-containing protein [Saprospiraceae bacterium]